MDGQESMCGNKLNKKVVYLQLVSFDYPGDYIERFPNVYLNKMLHRSWVLAHRYMWE